MKSTSQNSLTDEDDDAILELVRTTKTRLSKAKAVESPISSSNSLVSSPNDTPVQSPTRPPQPRRNKRTETRTQKQYRTHAKSKVNTSPWLQGTEKHQSQGQCHAAQVSRTNGRAKAWSIPATARIPTRPNRKIGPQEERSSTRSRKSYCRQYESDGVSFVFCHCRWLAASIANSFATSRTGSRSQTTGRA